MAKAEKKTVTVTEVTLTLTLKESRDLKRLLVNEEWPADKDHAETLNDISDALDDAGIYCSSTVD